MIGFADDILLNFVELVNAEDTTRILAIGASFLTKTRTETNKGQGKIFGLQNFVLVHPRNRDFSGAHQVEVLIIYLVDLVAPLGKLTAADKSEVACHGRDDEWRKSLAGHALHGEIDQGQLHACRVSFQHVAAAACDFNGTLDIDHI